MKLFGLAATALAAGVLIAGTACGQQLVYTPRDPSFGGNPFNSSHLLGLANAQNQFQKQSSQPTTSEGELFAQQLRSRLLSDLATQVEQDIFGDTPKNSGTYTVEGETVSFFRDLTGVHVTITDPTGASTTITLPATGSSSASAGG